MTSGRRLGAAYLNPFQRKQSIQRFTRPFLTAQKIEALESYINRAFTGPISESLNAINSPLGLLNVRVTSAVNKGDQYFKNYQTDTIVLLDYDRCYLKRMSRHNESSETGKVTIHWGKWKHTY